MKVMRQKIKNMIRESFFIYYILKCKLHFFLSGMKGISYVIQNMPSFYLTKIIKRLGGNISNNVTIDTGIILHRLNSIESFKNLKIGDHSHLGHNILLDLTKKIEIGRDTAFGANCQIWTHTGNWTKDRTDEIEKVGDVCIGNAVICYSGVIISQGITIGDYARVGGNSIVLKDVKPNSFVAGNPAREIKMFLQI